jgi:predicted DNA binding protein
MGVIADLDVPSEDTILGRFAKTIPARTLEVAPTVATSARPFPLLWIYGEDQWAIETAIENGSIATVVDVVDTHDDHRLYRLVWNDTDDFGACIESSEAILFDAVGDGDQWWFQIHFAQPSAFTSFQAECQQRGIDVVPNRIVNGERRDGGCDHLTAEQREVLSVAVNCGYFDVPRQCSLKTIAEELGISDQAVSARIRRGLKEYLSGEFLQKSAPHHAEAK